MAMEHDVFEFLWYMLHARFDREISFYTYIIERENECVTCRKLNVKIKTIFTMLSRSRMMVCI